MNRRRFTLDALFPAQFNAENWQDALANVQTAAVRLRHDLDELKRSLGYEEPT